MTKLKIKVDIYTFIPFDPAMPGTNHHSIKTILPELGSILRVEASWLYERQRALVRGNLIALRPGRGPGSGALATPHSMALLLISVLASDGLTEIVARTAQLAKSPAQFGNGPERCPMTNAAKLMDAFASVLESVELLNKLREVVVERDTLDAKMIWGRGRNRDYTVRFSKSDHSTPAGLHIRAAVGFEALTEIQTLIRKDGQPA